AAIVAELSVVNFALWQIGLLALVFQELNRGYATIGGGTRKGQGIVAVTVPSVTFRYPEIVYRDTHSGIVSAQGHLPSGVTMDAPATLSDERSLVLFAGLEPQPGRDWRDDGLVTLAIDGDGVERLFAESVEKAWLRWLPRAVEAKD